MCGQETNGLRQQIGTLVRMPLNLLLFKGSSIYLANRYRDGHSSSCSTGLDAMLSLLCVLSK